MPLVLDIRGADGLKRVALRAVRTEGLAAVGDVTERQLGDIDAQSRDGGDHVAVEGLDVSDRILEDRAHRFGGGSSRHGQASLALPSSATRASHMQPTSKRMGVPRSTLVQ